MMLTSLHSPHRTLTVAFASAAMPRRVRPLRQGLKSHGTWWRNSGDFLETWENPGKSGSEKFEAEEVFCTSK